MKSKKSGLLLLAMLLCVAAPGYAGYLDKISIGDCIQASTADCLKAVCINPAPADCDQQCRKNAQKKCKALSNQIDILGYRISPNSTNLRYNRTQ